MRRTAPAYVPGLVLGAAVITAAVALAHAGVAEAQNYRRPADTAATPAPAPPGDPRNSRGGATVTLTGVEAPAYGYGYATVLPADGRWRWIDARCYASGGGEQVCVDGHWVRRQPGQCEEVSAHQVRRGNYIRLVPAGPVASCR